MKNNNLINFPIKNLILSNSFKLFFKIFETNIKNKVFLKESASNSNFWTTHVQILREVQTVVNFVGFYGMRSDSCKRLTSNPNTHVIAELYGFS